MTLQQLTIFQISELLYSEMSDSGFLKNITRHYTPLNDLIHTVSLFN